MNLGEYMLHDIVRFRRAFPILSARRELAWGHYRIMLRLPTGEQHRFYERMADRHHWSTRALEPADQGGSLPAEPRPAGFPPRQGSSRPSAAVLPRQTGSAGDRARVAPEVITRDSLELRAGAGSGFAGP